MRQGRNVEILAPAGSYESIRAAVAAGADAVYAGGHRFGARAFADNLDEERMCEAIDFVHLRGKRLYLTVNTLMKEEEMGELYAYLAPYYERGLDAAIVQDPGVLRFLHREFPGLALHASTQMTVTSPESSVLLKDYGVTRIVPARELSIEEIASLKERSGLEIECFVHGALCYCYSGQCLMSSFAGSRSGNRGRCAQPCRSEYRFETEDGSVRRTSYALSPKDICTLDEIPDLIEAGVDSFKIEGRMKKPEYAGMTAHLYRKYADLYLELGREGYEAWQREHAKEAGEDRLALMDLYNRGGFSKGYYHQTHGPQMMSVERPNHSGVKVGKVLKVSRDVAQVRLSREVFAQDVLEFRRSGVSSYEFTRKDAAPAGAVIDARLMPGSDVRAGDELFRTRRNELIDRIDEAWLAEDAKIPVQGRFEAAVGEPLRLALRCGDASCEICGETVQPAQKQPMSAESAEKTLRKTGEEIFCFETLSCEVGENTFQTVGNIKNLRRAGFAQLREAMLAPHRRNISQNLHKNVRKVSPVCKEDSGIVRWESQVETQEQLREVLACAQITRVFLPYEWESKELLRAIRGTKETGREAWLYFPRICRAKEFAQLAADEKGQPEIFRAADGFLCGNLEIYAWLRARDFFGKGADAVCADASVYHWNSEAGAFYDEIGFRHLTLPLELEASELAGMRRPGECLVVYGRPALMTSVQCLRMNQARCTGIPETMRLKDVKGRGYLVRNHCRFCYNEILAEEAVWLGGEAEAVRRVGPGAIRFVFTAESGKETADVLRAGAAAFAGDGSRSRGVIPGEVPVQTGHFMRKAD
ncbi:MAG: U32 family peptidase [Lachnospiraceae bacterium]|nr:U32 family peptidase [Lachnospiraceae bacterium]